ncbi:MAG: radical SAM protein [Verrucomicrobia bacterium]|nr:radical SAM protein [Verrucomicrobiota bacterium]
MRSSTSHLAGGATSGRVYRLVVEITNTCNLACVMCPRQNMKRKARHMSREMFAEIIRANHPHLEFVSLNGFGEPLLHPNLIECLEVCRKHGVSAGISTNATQLDEEMALSLLACPPNQITIAFDGVTRETYESVRKGARFDAVLENVARFLRLRQTRRAKTHVVLQCICMTETKHEVRKFRDFFAPYRFDAIRIRQLTHSGKERSDTDYRNRSCSCYWLWNEPMVLSDGTVVPCCQDVNAELALGNIQQQPLARLWQEGTIRELRRKHAAGERDSIPICRACNMYQPGLVLSLGAACFNMTLLNRWVPAVETMISLMRYR